MKILFLDIDGVINLNNDPANAYFDEYKIKILSDFVYKNDLKIVLHSGWRLWLDNDLESINESSGYLIKSLNKSGLHLFSKTPDLSTEEIRNAQKFSLVKADEILLWLETHKNVSKWIVIDDLDLHNEIISKHQIMPDSLKGLLPGDIEKAEKLLLCSDSNNYCNT